MSQKQDEPKRFTHMMRLLENSQLLEELYKDFSKKVEEKKKKFKNEKPKENKGKEYGSELDFIDYAPEKNVETKEEMVVIKPHDESKKSALDWLKDESERLLGMDLTDSIIKVLEKTKSDLELQSNLFDIVGENGFELLSTIIEKKHMILKESYEKKVS